MFFIVLLLLAWVPIGFYYVASGECSEDWKLWREYRNALHQPGLSKMDRERITVLYWINNHKF